MKKNEELFSQGYELCMQGQVQELMAFLHSAAFGQQDSQIQQQQINALFIYACTQGNLQMVKQMLLSSAMPMNAQINFRQFTQYNDDGAFEWACSSGQLEVAHYVLTSSELKQRVHLPDAGERAFNLACSSGHLKVVEYLATELGMKATASNDNGFLWACTHAHLEVVQYLLSISSWQEHHKRLEALENILSNHHDDLLKFLVLEYCIPEEKSLDVVKRNYPQLEALFKTRNLKEKLQQQLDVKKPLYRAKV